MMNTSDSQEAALEAIELARERAANPSYVYGLPYGLPSLDKMTGGVQTKPYNYMTVLISAPGVGKSALAGKAARNIATYVRDHRPGDVIRIALFEMSATAFQQRIACIEAGVSLSRIRSGHVTQDQLKRYELAQHNIANLPIEYLDSQVPVDELVRFIAKDGNCAWWMLDHVGLVPGINNTASPHAALAGISIALSSATRRYAPSLIIGHQNRESEQGADKRPTLRSVAGSAQIGRDADVLLGLYREDIYTHQAEEERNKPRPGELLVLKNREGPLGTVHMIFNQDRVDWAENPLLNKGI